MALAYLDGDRVRLRSEWRERELAKAAGCRWDDHAKTWWTSLSWATCVTLRGVFGDDLEISQGLSEWAQRERESRVDPCLELRLATDRQDVYCPEGLELEPLQSVGVAFLATAGRALLGDGLGSGKTVEAICAVEEMARRRGDDAVFPCLVVCTNTMCRTWVSEIERWSGREVALVKGGATTRRRAIEAGSPWMVINWEGLKSHARLARYGSIALTDKEREPGELNEAGVRTVVADEAHRAKNPRAKQTRAWWQLAWDADNCVAMTGTPVNRSPDDLWSIMHGVCPEEWPSRSAWIDMHCLKTWSPFGGMQINGLRGDTEPILRRYLDPRFIRRPTDVVIPHIAEKLSPQVRRVDMQPKQRRAYEQMRRDMIALLDDDEFVMARDGLSHVTRMLQLASAYGEVGEDGEFTMADPSCKVDAMMDVLDELDDDPVVVFARHRQLIDLAAARLDRAGVEYGIVTGNVPELERAQHVRRFQAGELPVFLATISAGGEGITLTRARHVLFLQRDFSRSANEQATDRVWRRGQDRPVQPIWLVSDGTMEQRVIELGERRDQTFEEVVRDRDTVREMLGA